MSISDRDRKILWARSGNQCAICKIALVAERTADDAEAVVGDEAHIAGRSPGGPRYGECDPKLVDTYDNRILLCKVDHKLIDDQVKEYTTERLRRIKVEHESWVKSRLRQEGDEPELRLEIDPADGPLRLTMLRTGSDVWNVVSRSHSYLLGDLDEENARPDQLDTAAEFLQLAKDWGEISEEITDQGMVAVRNAKQSLSGSLEELTERGLVAFGGRRRHILKGGVGPPSYWHEAVLEVARADDVRIVTEPPEPAVPVG